ncbi:MAG: hypothetical protein E7596_04555 [Ruminococcaceae bacterium]|nr:hypothetical protein [Oscillospiraceae bacterium]
MEEKYTQMKLNLDSVEDSSVETVAAAGEMKKKVISKFDEPETIPIDIAESRSEAPIDEDVLLVSPDEDVFTRVTENVNNDKLKDTLTTEWHDSTADSDENFIVDEMYASTAHADRKFMETFGIKSTNKTKTISQKEDLVSEAENTADNAPNDGYEYTERLQNQEIKNMYDFAVKGIGKRLLFSFIFTLALFVLENFTLVFKNLTGIFSIAEYPYVHLGVGTGLLVLSAICAHEQIYHGFKSIINREFSPESVGVISLAIGLIHSITSIVLVSFGYIPTVMFNFVSSAVLLGTILYSFVNVVREEYGFRVIASKDAKFILERVHQGNAEAEYDTFTTTSNGEYNGQIARIEKTGFVRNYFYNTNANVDIRKFMGIYYLVVLVLSIAVAVFYAVSSRDVYSVTSYFGVSLLLMLPIGTLCAYSVPFYLGNKRLFDDDTAIIGEDSVKSFSKIDVVVVNETTAFPPQNIKIQHLHVYNDYTIEKVLYYASKGFSVVGGALAEVFDAAANEIVTSTRGVRFMCSGRGYLGVRVDGEKVIFADKLGMTSQGIEVGNEREGKEGLCPMYIAVDGILAAKLYLKYEIDEEFLRITKLLNKNGTGVGIRSFDPNLNNDLIKKLTSFKKRDLRVIKLTSVKEITKQTESRDGKIVSRGLSKCLIKAVPVCKKILFTRKVIKAIKIIASLGGAVLAALWAFGKLSFAFSAHIVGYHLVFVLIMMLASLVSMPKLK